MTDVPITVMACLGFVVAATGLGVLLYLRKRSSFFKDYWLLVVLILLISLLKNSSNVLEWSGITVSLDFFEDFIEILQSALLGILFYSIFQHRLLLAVQTSENKSRQLVQQMTANQAEREDLLHKLEFKNRELQSIVYVASHDLKSPLVNILGFNGELRLACKKLSDTLRGSNCVELQKAIKPLVKDIQESQMFIESGGQKMQVLIDGLLAVSRIGTQPVRIGPINMNMMLENILRTMKFQLQNCGVEVEVGTLPECLGDPAQVNQVFTNLVDNAIKYLDRSRPGRITISGATSGGMSVYRVTDNGIGIRPEYFGKIFEIYHRLNPENESSGQGLGLTIVSRIMERLGGRVEVESEYGKGSTFIIKLPTAVS